MDDLISVIVPIYSVEPYLKKCVDSIINQTYKNLEIILVDDGSPDNCPQICDEYAKADSRIKVIHQKNGGLSAARNAGLDIMTGDYVAFVDSDDWIEPTMYETLLKNLISFSADISFGGVADDVEENNEIKTNKVSNYGSEPFSEDKISAMKRYFTGSWAAWDKLYKASIFSKIRFPVGEINEDEAIVLDILDSCNLVCYEPCVLYHYMIRPNAGSITNSAFSEKKLAWVKHCRYNYYLIINDHQELKEYAANKYCCSLLFSIYGLISIKSENKKIKVYIKELRKNIIPFLTIKQTNKTKIKIIIYCFFPLFLLVKGYNLLK